MALPSQIFHATDIFVGGHCFEPLHNPMLGRTYVFALYWVRIHCPYVFALYWVRIHVVRIRADTQVCPYGRSNIFDDAMENDWALPPFRGNGYREIYLPIHRTIFQPSFPHHSISFRHWCENQGRHFFYKPLPKKRFSHFF